MVNAFEITKGNVRFEIRIAKNGTICLPLSLCPNRLTAIARAIAIDNQLFVSWETMKEEWQNDTHKKRYAMIATFEEAIRACGLQP